jgi:hypothetical protein
MSRTIQSRPRLLRRCDYEVLQFLHKSFFPKYLLLLINATRKKIKHAQPTSLSYDTMATMAPRPLVRNRAKTQRGLGGSLQKGYQRVAGVSTHRFDEAATKKA